MARDMNISQRSMSRIVSQDFQVEAYKRYTSHFFTERLKEMRCRRAKALLAEHGKENYEYKTDSIHRWENFYNWTEIQQPKWPSVCQIVVWGKKKTVPPIQKGHHPASVMVWLGVSCQSVTLVHFCKTGVKTSAQGEVTMLEEVVEPFSDPLFADAHWIFQ